jgi:hypothetical protein
MAGRSLFLGDNIAENTLAASSTLRVERRAGDGRRVRREEASFRRREQGCPRLSPPCLHAGTALRLLSRPRLVTASGKLALFRDAWAATPHGRLMLTVLGGLAEFERELIRARAEKVGRAQ